MSSFYFLSWKLNRLRKLADKNHKKKEIVDNWARSKQFKGDPQLVMSMNSEPSRKGLSQGMFSINELEANYKEKTRSVSGFFKSIFSRTSDAYQARKALGKKVDEAKAIQKDNKKIISLRVKEMKKQIKKDKKEQQQLEKQQRKSLRPT